jgi:hypothetical protein
MAFFNTQPQAPQRQAAAPDFFGGFNGAQGTSNGFQPQRSQQTQQPQGYSIPTQTPMQPTQPGQAQRNTPQQQQTQQQQQKKPDAFADLVDLMS